MRAVAPDLWAPDELRELYAQAVAPLGLDAQVVEGPELPRPGPRPVLVNTWVGFVRPRPALHQCFYQELRQRLEEQDVLPEALAAVVSEHRVLTVTANDGIVQSSSSAPSSRRRLLMPLPTNDEVSHLVAHGQRVLATAHNEQALSVLREKIPAVLRDLAISMLGSTQVAQGQPRSSVQAIMDAVSDLDPDTESIRLENLMTELDSTRAQQDSLQCQLLDLLRDEAAEFPMPGGAAKAADVAAWLAAHQNEVGPHPGRARTRAGCARDTR